ncbi:STM4014 family protein [Streptomyces sp. B3I8]|uniref:STM4014 family protein n=1 Tax=Streptomyces sp. B3I8 TaxID=3042303 RepID=UPI002780E9DC|nr:STM4014 family protein [Streptomyces sp. B3I8]MDQ0791302.1 glutathione synthase/RimK-type ligase-like ATP-grasp enzyme [Streptomyces sp. B3I8]
MSVPDAVGPRTPREALSAAPGAGTGAHAAPAVGPSDPSPAVPHAPRLAVVGNPDNRRVALFAQAVRAAGLPGPRVVPWIDVLREGGADFAPDETVRLDSPGEDPEIDRLLRDAGDPARVEGSARWYARFTAAVATLRGGVRLDDPDDLAVLFDKRRCHAVLDAAGVPVPASPTSGPDGAPVRGWDDVRSLMRAHRMPRLFVKLAHGSSASGVLAVETAGARIRATTSVERAPDGRLYNSLKVRRYESEQEIAAIVDTLAHDGLHLERWLPKASQQGRAADLRVVVVAGRATHAVVRTSRAPMTNLHLGGTRGDLDAAREAVERAGARWADVLQVCERAAACFPRTLCVGVDLLPATGWRRFVVGEVNAFGDLLPGLTGLPGSGAESADTYAAQVAAVLHGPGATGSHARPGPRHSRSGPADAPDHGSRLPRHPSHT